MKCSVLWNNSKQAERSTKIPLNQTFSNAQNFSVFFNLEIGLWLLFVHSWKFCWKSRGILMDPNLGSYPSLFFPSLSLHCCSNSSLNQANVVRIKSSKSCELIPSFIQRCPISLTLQLHSNQRWKRDYSVKLGLKYRMTLKITYLVSFLQSKVQLKNWEYLSETHIPH